MRGRQRRNQNPPERAAQSYHGFPDTQKLLGLIPPGLHCPIPIPPYENLMIDIQTGGQAGPPTETPCMLQPNASVWRLRRVCSIISTITGSR